MYIHALSLAGRISEVTHCCCAGLLIKAVLGSFYLMELHAVTQRFCSKSTNSETTEAALKTLETREYLQSQHCLLRPLSSFDYSTPPAP